MIIVKSKKIIVDGSWRVGKTTFCEKLQANGWRYITEPDHQTKARLRKCNAEELNAFYILAHFKNMLKLENTTQSTILERCIFSAFAYNYAINNKIWKIIWNEIKNSVILRDTKVYVFYRDYRYFLDDIRAYNKNGVLVPKNITLRLFYTRFVKAWKIVTENYPQDVELIKLKGKQFVGDMLMLQK